jgi:hypothetical protein
MSRNNAGTANLTQWLVLALDTLSKSFIEEPRIYALIGIEQYRRMTGLILMSVCFVLMNAG